MQSRGILTGLRSRSLNLMRLNKAICSLALVWLQSPVSVQAEWWMDCKQSWREGLRDTGGSLFSTSQQCVLADQKANRVLSSIKRSVASRLWEVMLPFTPLSWKPIQSTASFSGGTPQYKEQVQRRVRKMINGLEHLSCEDSLRESGCSAWRREGSGETLLWPQNTVRGLLRKVEKEAVFTRAYSERQGQMVSDWKRVGLD